MVWGNVITVKMIAGDSDLARNNALTSREGQTLEESQRGFDKWAPTYEQVRFYGILKTTIKQAFERFGFYQRDIYSSTTIRS